MGDEVRRYYMEKDFSGVVKETTPKQVKSLMRYVGYIIAVGVTGIVTTLFFIEVIFT